jgi:hypothetical protein
LSEARPVQSYLPEQLKPLANLICNGTVLSVEQTELKDSMYPYITPPAIHERIMRARIKVLHVFKGAAPAEIELRYTTWIPDKMMGNNPEHINLQKGERYRFFLKPDEAHSGYVGVLDGGADDDFAVELLSPNEPDDSPYLQKDEAIRIALDYARSKRPGETFEPSQANVLPNPNDAGGASWCVTLVNGSGPVTNHSNVTVLGNRSVDEAHTDLD